MASILKVDQLQKPDGSTPTAADLGIDLTANDMPAGSIIQVVHQKMTAGATTNGVGTYLEFSAGNVPTLTKKLTDSRVYADLAFNLWGDIDHDSHGYVFAHILVEKWINGTYSTTEHSVDNMIDRGGQTRSRHTIVKVDTSGNVAGDVVTFRCYAQLTTTSAGRNLNINSVPSFATLYEISN